MDDLIYSSAKSIAQAIRDKEVSSVEAVEAHLERIEEVNPKLNAVVQVVAERALEEAREADNALARGESKGPLHGVPITLKDSHDTEGIITTGGTKGRNEYVPDKDSTVTERLRGAGAILLGKTNTPELTMYAETLNLVYGTTNNPYDTSRSPGGSSGGAGAIIASGGSPLDMGSDTGGSIRYPAHFCGIAGLKPNSGRVPRTGHIVPYGFGPTDAYTQIGPMSRYVEDLILTLPIISGPDWRDPAIAPAPLGNPADISVGSLRIATYTDNGIRTPTAETIIAINDAAKSISDTGATVTQTLPPGIDQARDISNAVSSADGRWWTKRLLEKWGTTEIHPVLQKRIDDSEEVSSTELSKRLEALEAFRADMLAFMEDYDVILAPVAAFPALPHGVMMDDDHEDGMTYANPYNLTGWPGAVVRGGTSPDGLPIGVMIISQPWREDVALAVAQHLENELGGWQKPSI